MKTILYILNQQMFGNMDKDEEYSWKKEVFCYGYDER